MEPRTVHRSGRTLKFAGFVQTERSVMFLIFTIRIYFDYDHF